MATALYVETELAHRGLWCLKKNVVQAPPHTPQTVLALRGSHGVGVEGAMAGVRIRPWTRPLIFLLFTILGDTYPQKHTMKVTYSRNFNF